MAMYATPAPAPKLASTTASTHHAAASSIAPADSDKRAERRVAEAALVDDAREHRERP